MKIKLWKLEDEYLKREFEYQKLMTEKEWKQFEKHTLQPAAEVCGGRDWETWWWNGKVQENITKDRITFKKWQRIKAEKHRRRYIEKKKRQVAKSKGKAWEG